MKKALKISVLLNLGLGGALIFFLIAEKHPLAPASPPGGEEMPQQAIKERPPAAQVTEELSRPAPFRWSQLTSADYHMYVRNLRESGCPEGTVRAIVANDVHAVFRKLDDELDQRLAELDNASWSVRLEAFNTEQTVRAQRAALPALETDEIADLLGLARTGNRNVPTAVATVPTPPVNDEPVALPLVFQNVNAATMNPTPEQLQVINDVRQSFLNEIGGANQDPTDPAYLQRWQKALPAADDMLRGMLGGSFFENYQLATVGN